MPSLRMLVSTAMPAALFCVAAGTATAQSQCNVYSVQSGDSLSGIASRAGVSGGYRAIFNANRGTLQNPNTIRVGQELQIPCADGSVPGGGSVSGNVEQVINLGARDAVQVINAKPNVTVITTSVAPVKVIELTGNQSVAISVSATPAMPKPAESPSETTASTAEPAEKPAETRTETTTASTTPPAETNTTTAPANEPITIKFVTGTFPPWSGEELPDQGFFTELIRKSLEASGSNIDYTVTFVEDWNSHLDVLLPTMAFDMTYPWALPDCSRIENLDAANARRCNEFDATGAFISAPTGFYTLKDNPLAESEDFADLRGKRLCRPEGHFTFDLQAEELTPPNVILMQPQTAGECWNALMEGKVDVVTYSVMAAEEEMMASDADDRVVATPLETVQSSHIFISKNNPRSAEFRDALDKGLEEIRANGEWFAIVSRHLSEREARLSEAATK